MSTLFSSEFYGRVRRHLNAGGLLVQWIQYYELDDALLASVEKALSPVFADYVIYESAPGDLLVVASPEGKVPALDVALFGTPSVQAQLAYAGVGARSEWAVRRLAGKSMAHAYFSSYPTPGNSDYFPVLDMGAARTRFLSRLASGVVTLKTAPVRPGEWLGEPAVQESERPDPVVVRFLPRSSGYVHAARESGLAYAALVTGQGKPEVLAKQIDPRWYVVRTSRDHCAIEPHELDEFLGVLTQVAGDVNNGLTLKERETFWPLLRKNACVQRYADQTKGFMSLFEAISRRDAAAMAREAHALRPTLAVFHSPELIDTLGLSELTGWMATRQSKQAREALSFYAAKISKGRPSYSAFRLLTKLILMMPA